ncbi:MAG: hypothetical protein ABEH59_09705 [Halobacteriales archaeon]
MDPSRTSVLLHGGVILALAIGVGLIIGGGSLLTGVGVVLVITGLIGLMPALRYRLEANQPSIND